MWVYELLAFIKEWWFLISAIIVAIISFKKGIESINSNLKDVIYQLKEFNEKIMLSERDREKIHAELAIHDTRLDVQEKQTAIHEERIKTLFKERG